MKKIFHTCLQYLLFSPLTLLILVTLLMIVFGYIISS